MRVFLTALLLVVSTVASAQATPEERLFEAIKEGKAQVAEGVVPRGARRLAKLAASLADVLTARNRKPGAIGGHALFQ